MLRRALNKNITFCFVTFTHAAVTAGMMHVHRCFSQNVSRLLWKCQAAACCSPIVTSSTRHGGGQAKQQEIESQELKLTHEQKLKELQQKHCEQHEQHAQHTQHASAFQEKLEMELKELQQTSEIERKLAISYHLIAQVFFIFFFFSFFFLTSILMP